LGEDRLAEDTGGTMAKAGAANKTTAKTEMEPPRAYGPRGIGGLVARVARPAFRRRSPAASQIMTEWATILGPNLGARTAPHRFTAGTLTIACDGPVAMELQHLAPQLIARINGHVGQRLVERLRFVQLAVVSHVIEPPRAPRPPATPPPIEGISPGPLHDALARLGGAVKAAAAIRRESAPKRSGPGIKRDSLG
jgi:hypothetical protein